jgi:hypothetical protein
MSGEDVTGSQGVDDPTKSFTSLLARFDCRRGQNAMGPLIERDNVRCSSAATRFWRTA